MMSLYSSHYRLKIKVKPYKIKILKTPLVYRRLRLLNFTLKITIKNGIKIKFHN